MRHLHFYLARHTATRYTPNMRARFITALAATLLASAIAFAAEPQRSHKRCTGDANCRACTTCERCQYCRAKGPGKHCGASRPASAPATVPAK